MYAFNDRLKSPSPYLILRNKVMHNGRKAWAYPGIAGHPLPLSALE
jgi:hypothetical protein